MCQSVAFLRAISRRSMRHNQGLAFQGALKGQALKEALKGIEGTDGVTPNVSYGGYSVCPGFCQVVNPAVGSNAECVQSSFFPSFRLLPFHGGQLDC